MLLAFIGWFQLQTEFTTDFETMEVNEMNVCPSFTAQSGGKTELLQEK